MTAQARDLIGVAPHPTGEAAPSVVEPTAELVMESAPQSAAAESVRSLRVQLGFRWRGATTAQTLCVVSAERGEGRSFIAANLALAFAELNERTLLIDADLRHPRQQTIFGIGGRLGLTSLLHGRGTMQHIQAVQSHRRLRVLPAGPPSAHPQELLASHAWRQLLEQCRTEFDIVIIDTPAWSHGADALAVCAEARQALLVSAPGRATRDATGRLVAGLRRIDVEIVGAAVNQR